MTQQKAYAIDSHPVFLKGMAVTLKEIEGIHYCGGTNKPEHAIQGIMYHQPHLVVIDININRSLRGFHMIQVIRRRYPHTKILVVTEQDEFQYVQRALQSGAHGFVSKYDGLSQLKKAIQTVLQDKIYLDQTRTDQFLHLLTDTSLRPSEPYKREELTDREREVMDLLQHGKNSSEIAKILNIHPKTVYAHQKKIRTKLGLQSNFALFKYALQKETKPLG